jgi:hypothetical protein
LAALEVRRGKTPRIVAVLRSFDWLSTKEFYAGTVDDNSPLNVENLTTSELDWLMDYLKTANIVDNNFDDRACLEEVFTELFKDDAVTREKVISKYCRDPMVEVQSEDEYIS